MTDITIHMPQTGRTLERVLDLHNLTTMDLGLFEGATIYDFGCGHSDLGYGLAEQGIVANVSGFDQDPDHASGGTQNIRARLDNIPAKTESADIVLATFSLPYWPILLMRL